MTHTRTIHFGRRTIGLGAWFLAFLLFGALAAPAQEGQRRILDGDRLNISVEEQAEIWGKHPQAGEYDSSRMRDQIVDGIMRRIAEAQGNGGVVE